MLAVFRRDFAENNQGRIVPRSFTQPIQKKLSITPKTLSTLIFGSLILIIIMFFIRQIINFYQGPKISIERPTQDQVVTSPLEIAGQVSQNAQVMINNQAITVTE